MALASTTKLQMDGADTGGTYSTHRTFDSLAANLFGNLFNEWLANGDSGALTYKVGPADAEDSASDPAREVLGSEFVDKEEGDVRTDGEEEIIPSEKAAKSLENMRRDLKDYSYWLQCRPLTVRDVRSAIHGLQVAAGLVDEEKRTALKAFLENF